MSDFCRTLKRLQKMCEIHGWDNLLMKLGADGHGWIVASKKNHNESCWLIRLDDVESMHPDEVIKQLESNESQFK